MVKRIYFFLFIGAIALFIFQLAVLDYSDLNNISNYFGLFAALILIFIFGKGIKRIKKY
jgi:hypothetical protein